MRKKINAFFITAVLAASLSGCAGSNKENKITDADMELRNSAENTGETEILSDNGDVDLTVWGGEEDEALLARIIEDFQTEYKGQANFRSEERRVGKECR